jgi:hypothetical protein
MTVLLLYSASYLIAGIPTAAAFVKAAGEVVQVSLYTKVLIWLGWLPALLLKLFTK